MRSDRGVGLLFAGVVLLGIFGALVEQRYRRVRHVGALLLTDAVLSDSVESVDRLDGVGLLVPSSSLAALARISYPSRRQETCPSDAGVGPEIDDDGLLRVPPCAHPFVAKYRPGVSFPDGSLPLGPGDIYGNLTVGVCQARLPNWRPTAVDEYIRDDNGAVYRSEDDTLVRCYGYVWRPPSDHCTHPIDVLVAGFPYLQPISTLAVRALVSSIELRPRVPWRDAVELDRYVNVSAWGIPFELQPDGTYFADFGQEGHWSDTLGATTVAASCPGFCRPYPMDIYLCTAECPCAPTTTTTVATTTTTTTVFPACAVSVHGGLARVLSQRVPVDQGYALLYEETTYDVVASISVGGVRLNATAARDFPFTVVRPNDCVDSCMRTGAISNCWEAISYFLLVIDPDDFIDRKIVTPIDVASTRSPPGRESYLTPESPSALSYNPDGRGKLYDCCFSAARNGVQLRTYYAQDAVVFRYLSDRVAYSGKLWPVSQTIEFSGYIYTTTVSQASRVVDQRTTTTEGVPAAGQCLVAFDVLGDARATFTAWEARDDNDTVVMRGDLVYNHSVRAVMLQLDCSASLDALAWTLYSTDEFPGTASAAGVFSDRVPPQPACGDVAREEDAQVTQHDILAGSVFDRGVGVRILSMNISSPCVAPDPLPADDATAFLFTAVCPLDAVCVDLRS